VYLSISGRPVDEALAATGTSPNELSGKPKKRDADVFGWQWPAGCSFKLQHLSTRINIIKRRRRMDGSNPVDTSINIEPH